MVSHYSKLCKSIYYPKLDNVWEFMCKIFYHHPGSSLKWTASCSFHLQYVWMPGPGSHTGRTCPDRSAGHCGWCSPPPPRSWELCPSPSPYIRPETHRGCWRSLQLSLFWHRDHSQMNGISWRVIVDCWPCTPEWVHYDQPLGLHPTAPGCCWRWWQKLKRWWDRWRALQKQVRHWA